jgi:hypothetical protein
MLLDKFGYFLLFVHICPRSGADKIVGFTHPPNGCFSEGNVETIGVQ